MVRAVVQEFLEAKMAEAVGAQEGERVEGRLSYRSADYARSLIRRVRKLELRVPQDRNGRFSTEIFERYERSEKALVAAPTEMYIHQPVALSWRQRRALSLIAVKELLPESYARPCERAGPKTTAGIAACKPNWSSTFTISDPPLRPQITSSQRS
jgi:Transposase, Mutator family